MQPCLTIWRQLSKPLKSILSNTRLHLSAIRFAEVLLEQHYEFLLELTHFLTEPKVNFLHSSYNYPQRNKANKKKGTFLLTLGFIKKEKKKKTALSPAENITQPLSASVFNILFYLNDEKDLGNKKSWLWYMGELCDPKVMISNEQ